MIQRLHATGELDTIIQGAVDGIGSLLSTLETSERRSRSVHSSCRRDRWDNILGYSGNSPSRCARSSPAPRQTGLVTFFQGLYQAGKRSRSAGQLVVNLLPALGNALTTIGRRAQLSRTRPDPGGSVTQLAPSSHRSARVSGRVAALGRLSRRWDALGQVAALLGPVIALIGAQLGGAVTALSPAIISLARCWSACQAAAPLLTPLAG